MWRQPAPVRQQLPSSDGVQAPGLQVSLALRGLPRSRVKILCLPAPGAPVGSDLPSSLSLGVLEPKAFKLRLASLCGLSPAICVSEGQAVSDFMTLHCTL